MNELIKLATHPARAGGISAVTREVPDVVGDIAKPLFAIRDRIKATLKALQGFHAQMTRWFDFYVKPEFPTIVAQIEQMQAQVEQLRAQLRADDGLLDEAVNEPASPKQINALLVVMARDYAKPPADLDHYASAIRSTLALPQDLDVDDDPPPPITRHALALAINKLRRTHKYPTAPSAAEVVEAYESAHHELVKLRSVPRRELKETSERLAKAQETFRRLVEQDAQRAEQRRKRETES
jgi:hypothetical protein